MISAFSIYFDQTSHTASRFRTFKIDSLFVCFRFVFFFNVDKEDTTVGFFPRITHWDDPVTDLQLPIPLSHSALSDSWYVDWLEQKTHRSLTIHSRQWFCSQTRATELNFFFLTLRKWRKCLRISHTCCKDHKNQSVSFFILNRKYMCFCKCTTAVNQSEWNVTDSVTTKKATVLLRKWPKKLKQFHTVCCKECTRIMRGEVWKVCAEQVEYSNSVLCCQFFENGRWSEQLSRVHRCCQCKFFSAHSTSAVAPVVTVPSPPIKFSCPKQCKTTQTDVQIHRKATFKCNRNKVNKRKDENVVQ